ncbi:AAA domain-containing protein [Bradyrhizobium pachyrhizi]|nr:AAA domain-containing protein [Bradyrhizobium pachyrhizi]WFU60101.1 AAA domain-containing protein [Bradyrhizobium pachyrhizi]
MLPDTWLLYVALQYLPIRQNPMDIDTVVVMDDRVLILELKNWNGELRSNGDVWILNEQPKGRSPVDLVAHKARVVGKALRDSIAEFDFYTDSGVVLTGSATAKHLSAPQASRTWSLAQLKAIVNPSSRSQLLEPRPTRRRQAYTFERELSKLFGSGRRFKPKEMIWDGYRVVQENVFVHRAFNEHRALLKDDKRHGALLRTWKFDELPVEFNTPTVRKRIAQWELNALGYLRQVKSELIRKGQVLELLGDTKEEILTQHYDLKRLGRDWVQLSNYLQRFREEMAWEDAVAMAQTLLNVVAELHLKNVAHRDIGFKGVWVGSSTQLALSGLAVAHLPGDDGALEWLPHLEAYSPMAHGALGRTFEGSAAQRDVVSLGVLCDEILTARETLAPSISPSLAAWLKKTSLTEPENLFADAVEMSNAFGQIVFDSMPIQADTELLDKFETDLNPLFEWRPIERLAKGWREVFLSQDPQLGDIVVKIWPKLLRGQSSQIDLMLVRLFDGLAKLKVTLPPGLPQFGPSGLSNIGAFLVYKSVGGYSLREEPGLSALNALQISKELLSTVDDLHRVGLEHGAIAETAIKIVTLQDGTRRPILDHLFESGDFIDTPVATAEWLPANWERLSVQHLDRYAVVKIVHGLISRVEDARLVQIQAELQSELERPAIEVLETISDRVAAALHDIQKPVAKQIIVGLVEPLIDTFESDSGFYFIRAERLNERVVKFVAYGLTHRLSIIAPADRPPAAELVACEFETIRREADRCVRISAEIRLERSDEPRVSQLLELFAEVPIAEAEVIAPSDEETEPPPLSELEPPAVERDGPLDIEKFWMRSIELEENLTPEIVLRSDPISTASGWSVKYELHKGNFDFDPEDLVDLCFPGRNRRVARLDTMNTDGSILALSELDLPLRDGDVLQLVERQQRTSYNRRKRAVDRILGRNSPIKNLITYFDPSLSAADLPYQCSPTDNELSVYELNQGQADAFRSIAENGPVGLLQGPPGTGKTYFIAAFVHWLITVQGVDRILIASQSHEAVNNVIVATAKLFRKFGKRPDLLRIGSKNITPSVKSFHIAAVREKYAATFLNSFKARVSLLARTAGIDRGFAERAIDLDRSLGELVRRYYFDLESDQAEERGERSIRARVARAIEGVLKKFGLQDLQYGEPKDALDAAFSHLVAENDKVSLADEDLLKKLLSLSREWKEAMGASSRNFEEFLAKTKSIVAGTCVGLGQTRIRLDKLEYDWVIVDEAARCTPGELAVPLQLGRRVLLVGDHRQLRPMVDEVVTRELCREFPVAGLSAVQRSDFERAFNSNFGRIRGQVLNEQYRMAEPICKLVSSLFYEPFGVRLSTSPRREPSRFFQNPERLGILRSCVTWVDTSQERSHLEKPGASNEYTYSNAAEATAILKLVARIYGEEQLRDHLVDRDEEHPIGIICMYKEQSAEIDRQLTQSDLPRQFRDRIRVDTVDSYQGKENTIVILSLVRSNRGGKIGHVRSPRRSNVAISRAKERLVIVGDVRMWTRRSDSPMGRVLKHLRALSKPDGEFVRAGDL